MNKSKNGKDKRSEIILKTFKDFGIKMELAEAKPGPISSYFILRLITPTRMKDLDGFGRDLNHALGSSRVRIDAPIPDTSFIGIEVPNKERAFVDLKEMWKDQKFRENKEKLMIPIGRMLGNEDLFVDLCELPHLLISGATGSGKSNFLNCLINSLMHKFTPEEVKFIFVDNKCVELVIYDGSPYLLAQPIVNPRKTMNALRWLNCEMERRYELLQQSGSINIEEYNKKEKNKIPYILFIEDEFADDIYGNKKNFEAEILTILQMGRAVGMHVVLATARPSKEVISSLACANINSRICFTVCCAHDSKEVLFSAGAESLLGEGDALFIGPRQIRPIRVQAPFISEKEVKENIRASKQKFGNVIYKTGEMLECENAELGLE